MCGPGGPENRTQPPPGWEWARADFLPFGQTDCLPELLGLGSSGDKGGERGARAYTCHPPPSLGPLPGCGLTSPLTGQLPNLPHAEMVSGNSNGSDIP